MSRYVVDNSLRAIAKEVIEENENLSNLVDIFPAIAFQYCDEEKKSNGKVVYADTEKVKPKYSALLPFFFIITFYEPSCANLDEDILKRLMYHELLHIGYDGDKMWVISHDLEDFRDVVGKWGINWIGGDKA